MTELLKLFSPLTAYKVEVFQKASTIVQRKNGFELPYTHTVINLLQNFEQLSLLPLKKEMFVPYLPHTDELEIEEDYDDYELAPRKVLFEGFEKYKSFVEFGDFQIGFLKNNSVSLATSSSHVEIHNCSVKDFINHIDKYNETATNKIEIKVTENFVKRISG